MTRSIANPCHLLKKDGFKNVHHLLAIIIVVLVLSAAFATISGYDGEMQAGASQQESCGEKAEIYHQ